MGQTREYSKRLGEISDHQFEAVAERWKLGRFLRAEPITSGLFGQNVFIITTQGEFVLRGAPHWIKGSGETEWRRDDRWQFTKEVFFARLLHERTKAPVPWPMLHDKSPDIFGWPFIVMPRMPGACFDERTIRKSLPAEDRHSVAIALGANLAEMQRLTWTFAGDFSPEVELHAYPGGHVQQLVRDIGEMVSRARQNGAMEEHDIAWIDAIASGALAVSGENRANSYVHCDYKLNNLTVLKGAAGWVVGGLFDLHEARFADGALDIVRQACSYLDTDAALAKVFVDTYRSLVPADPTLHQRLPLYVVNDRMKFWAFFTRPGDRANWSKGKTFRGWAQRYLDGILNLL